MDFNLVEHGHTSAGTSNSLRANHIWQVKLLNRDLTRWKFLNPTSTWWKLKGCKKSTACSSNNLWSVVHKIFSPQGQSAVRLDSVSWIPLCWAVLGWNLVARAAFWSHCHLALLSSHWCTPYHPGQGHQQKTSQTCPSRCPHEEYSMLTACNMECWMASPSQITSSVGRMQRVSHNFLGV